MTQRQMPLFASGQETGSAALISMLQTRRPGGTKSEKRFIQEWIDPLGVTADEFGNRVFRIGTAPILWSCHTDTVHRHGGTQRLRRRGNLGIELDPSSQSNCLGADDTAGVWLMREMILAKVPGLYVFHRLEEVGCKGSEWIVKNTPNLLKDIKFAVALDRKDYNEVITYQRGRCCSDEFATSLGDQLGMGYKPSNRGVWTDTAEYVDLIGECTNIGVGYFDQHSKEEWLDLAHILALRNRLTKINTDTLVEKRKPGEKSSYTGGWEGGDWGGCEYYYRGSGKAYGSHNTEPRPYTYKTWDYDTKQMVEKIHTPGHWKDGKYVAGTDVKVVQSETSTALTVVEKSAETPKTSVPQTKPHGVTKLFRGVVSTLSHGNANHGGTRHDALPNQNAPMNRTGDDHEGDTTTSKAKVTNDYQALVKLCRNHPEEVSDLLEQYGINATEVADHIFEQLNFIRLS